MPEVRVILPDRGYEQWIIWPSWAMWRWAHEQPAEAAMYLYFRDVVDHKGGVAGDTPLAPQGRVPDED